MLRKIRKSKITIAKKAINLVDHKDCILLDASTTTLELARLLAESNKQITVVTNGLSQAIELKENPANQCYFDWWHYSNGFNGN